MPRIHQAKFHLDKLEAEGLLESEYARLERTARAGRRPVVLDLPDRPFSVSLPTAEGRDGLRRVLP